MPAGSVLSYQQRLDDNIVLNIYDGVSFPDLPVNSCMVYSRTRLNTDQSRQKGEQLDDAVIFTCGSTLFPEEHSIPGCVCYYKSK